MAVSDFVHTLLKKLHQLEVDANHAYEECVTRLRREELKATMMEFKREHDAHLSDLEGLLRIKGFEVPNRSRDLKGLLLEGMALLRSSISDQQALKAMKQNELLTNKYYEEALESLGSANHEVEQFLEQALSEEQKHLSFILSELNENPKARAPKLQTSTSSSL